MLETVVVLCCLISIVFYYFEIIKCSVLSFIELKKLPYPSTSSRIIGNILELHTTPENILKKLREWGRKYYPIYNIRVLYTNAANILTPEDAELILSNSKHMEKSLVYNLLHGWLGSGLLTSTGKKWLIRRRILTPAFHFSILQQFISTFNEETENLVVTLKSQCQKPFVDINSHISQFTLKTIAETAMGTKLKFDTQKEIAYKQAIFDIGEIFLYRLLRSWLIVPLFNIFSPKYLAEKKTLKILHKFTKDVIAERQKIFQEIVAPAEDEVYVGKMRLAMLDLLLRAKSKEGTIDDDGIREEVDTFMFEGHDTTAVALGFALMLIACHKDVQDRIVQEMGEVLSDLHKKPTYNDLQEMKYMERSIKEVLRLYPSVHFISRKLGEDMTTVSGYYLPKSSVVHIHIYDLHHNPDIYPDPEKFDPDRFLPENLKSRHPFSYLPFSAGPRNCIGQRFAMLELKAAICGILANFVLEPVDTPDSIVLIPDLVLRTKDGIKIRFLPRM